MSRAMMCDECEVALALNKNGEADTGEDAAWLHIETGNLSADLCTKACLQEWLDDEAVVAHLESYQELISDIARHVNRKNDD